MLRWPGPEVQVRASTYGLMALAALVTVAVLFGDPGRKVGAFLWDWQTLIAGGLAIVAAWISLTGPRAQIAQAERLAREAAEREEAGARALLPMALSYIIHYARSCANASAELFQTNLGQAGNPIVLPAFDRSNIALVRDALRFAPPVHRKRMYALLNAVQIMEANAVSRTELAPDHYVWGLCVDVVYLCEMCFDYARRLDESFPSDAPHRAPPDYVRRTAFFDDRTPDFWPGLEDDLLRRERLVAVRQREGQAPPADEPAP